MRVLAVILLYVFDPENVGPAVPRIVNDLPGGGQRLSQGATGFAATVVAGRSRRNA